MATRFLAAKYHIWFSPGARGGIGGVAIFIDSSWMETHHARVSNEAFVVGRISRCLINITDFELVVWNVHNMDLNASDLAGVSLGLAKDRKATMINPMSHLTIVGGDMNYQAPGESSVHVAKPALNLLPLWSCA